MNTEDDVVDYIDSLLGEAPAGTVPAGPVQDAAGASSADCAAPATAADRREAASAADAPSEPAAAAAPPGPAQPAAPAPAAEPAPPAVPVAPPAAAPARMPHAGPPPDTTSSPVHAAPVPRWLRVRVGQASYALELLRVQEVVRLMPIVAMRGADAAVLGVMNLRGRIVPVFDLGLWLGTGRVDPREQSRIVVVERDDELIGLLVTAVDDVVTLGRDRIEPPLPGDHDGVVLGVARVGEVPTVLFDAHALYR